MHYLTRRLAYFRRKYYVFLKNTNTMVYVLYGGGVYNWERKIGKRTRKYRRRLHRIVVRREGEPCCPLRSLFFPPNPIVVPSFGRSSPRKVAAAAAAGVGGRGGGSGASLLCEVWLLLSAGV